MYIMESPRLPEISYASVVKGYQSSPKEEWEKYQTQGEQEAMELALSESLNDVYRRYVCSPFYGDIGET